MAIALKNIIPAIYTALTGSTTLMAKISGVFNEVPQNQNFPYVVIGDSDLTETKFNTFGRRGKDTRIYIHIHSLYKGDKEILDIADEIDVVLDWQDLTVTSNAHILTSNEGTQILREEDDSKNIKARHGIIEYRVLTQES